MFRITPITRSQVSSCLGADGVRAKDLRTLSEISKGGEIWQLARVILEREVSNLEEWELIGWNPWSSGDHEPGFFDFRLSTMVVKLTRRKDVGVIFKPTNTRDLWY